MPKYTRVIARLADTAKKYGEDVIPRRVDGVVVLVFRLVDIVPVLVFRPDVIPQLALQVVRAAGDEQLHVLHLVNACEDGTLPFLGGVDVHPSVVYLLDEARVCAVGINAQPPRTERLHDVRRKQVGTVVYLIQIKRIVNDSTPYRRRWVKRITEVQPDTHFFAPYRELVHNAPFLNTAPSATSAQRPITVWAYFSGLSFFICSTSFRNSVERWSKLSK